MIAYGVGHAIIRNEKNEIYTCGYNHYGQLGLGDKADRNKFEKVEFDFGKIKNIACGYTHTVIQNVKNEIYVCGSNYSGQLGLCDNENRDIFEKVEYDFGEIKNIAYGLYHAIIQNEKNEIYVCGFNGYGQLGLGDYKNRNKFEKVECDLGGIKNIVCGFFHIVIQNKIDEIYVCGKNEEGQLGLGDNKKRNKFEKVEYDFGGIKKIACGGNHTIILNEKNEIYVCGENRRGELGLGDNNNRNKFEKVEKNFGSIKRIVSDVFHIVIQNEKNEIYVCGGNSNGQLGLGDNIDRDKFEKVEHNFWEIKNIICSGDHIIIQDEKNGIYVCGSDGYGKLGLGDNHNRDKFEKVDMDNILEEVYDFEFQLNTKKIEL